MVSQVGLNSVGTWKAAQDHLCFEPHAAHCKGDSALSCMINDERVAVVRLSLLSLLFYLGS